MSKLHYFLVGIVFLFGIILIISFLMYSLGESEETTNRFSESTESKPINEPVTEPITDIKFIREATYGSTDEVIVGIVGPVTVDGSGRVFIADRNLITVHVFQPEGSYLTSLGRQGRGPGEFMGVTPNSSIAIHSNRFYITDQADAHLQFPYRMHVFSLEDLTFSHTIDLLAVNKAEFDELSGFYPKSVFPLNDDMFLVSYHRSPHEYRDEESVIYYVVQDSDGSIISSPVLEQKDRTNLTVKVILPNMWYTAIHSFPFYSKSLLTVSGDNDIYAVNHSGEFKIDMYTPQGKYVRNIIHSFENVPFIRNVTLDNYEKTNYMHALGEGVALRMIREADNLPDTWPALEGLLLDDQNRIWVSTIVENFDIYEWWVLEEFGEVVTKFEWPRDEPIEVVRDGYMYTRETDEETDLQTIVRYRIEMGGS